MDIDLRPLQRKQVAFTLTVMTTALFNGTTVTGLTQDDDVYTWQEGDTEMPFDPVEDAVDFNFTLDIDTDITNLDPVYHPAASTVLGYLDPATLETTRLLTPLPVLVKRISGLNLALPPLPLATEVNLGSTFSLRELFNAVLMVKPHPFDPYVEDLHAVTVRWTPKQLVLEVSFAAPE